MTARLCIAIVLLGGLASLGTSAESRPNILLICVDDLRPELNCYGVDHIHSPNIDALATKGTRFENHFVNAPTCGASRFTLLTGRYGGGDNHALFNRAKAIADGKPHWPSMPRWFRDSGYNTVSVGKVSHHPGGLGGDDWDDETVVEMPDAWDSSLLIAGPWHHPRGWMHGLANGEIRKSEPGTMAVYQSLEGDDDIYPDGSSIDEASRQIQTLASESDPFFLAVGILRPHLPFGAPAKYMARYEDVTLPPIPHPQKPQGRTTWQRSGEIRRYDLFGHSLEDAPLQDQLRRHYAACVSYADASVGRLVSTLQDTAAANNTIIVLWGDHGWHLGEHAVWGKHTLFEESLHSPLIIVRPGEEDSRQVVSGLVSTVDLFPTLCELAGMDQPDQLSGRSLRPMLQEPNSDGSPAFAAFRNGLKTVRTKSHRLIQHDDGYVELYDRRSDPGETKNVADDDPETVQRLRSLIELEMAD